MLYSTHCALSPFPCMGWGGIMPLPKACKSAWGRLSKVCAPLYFYLLLLTFSTTNAGRATVAAPAPWPGEAKRVSLRPSEPSQRQPRPQFTLRGGTRRHAQLSGEHRARGPRVVELLLCGRLRANANARENTARTPWVKETVRGALGRMGWDEIRWNGTRRRYVACGRGCALWQMKWMHMAWLGGKKIPASID